MSDADRILARNGEIRAAAAQGVSQGQLSRQFGISRSGVQRIIAGRDAVPAASLDTEFRDRVRLLWSGHLTQSQIAAQMGVSKCVISGLIHRLDLPARVTIEKPASPKPAADKSKREPQPVRVGLVPQHQTGTGLFLGPTLRLAPTPRPTPSVALVTGGRGTCQFPEGEKPWIMCGAPAHPGKSWCTPHCHIVFVDFKCASIAAPMPPAADASPTDQPRPQR